MWWIVLKALMDLFNVALLFRFFPSQKSSVAQGDYTSSLLCVYNPLLSAHHFVFLLSVWQFGNGKVRLRSEGFVDLVLGTVCLVNIVLEKRQQTCLKWLRSLSVQPMDCCNWETKTAKLMCELWASKQALNYVKQWLKGRQILKGWVWNSISLIFTRMLQLLAQRGSGPLLVFYKRKVHFQK